MTTETLLHIAHEWLCEVQITIFPPEGEAPRYDLATFWYNEEAIFSLVLLEQASVWTGARLSAELQQRTAEKQP